MSWSNRQLAQNLAAVAVSQGINKSGMFTSDARVGLDGNTTVAARTDGAGGFSWTSVASNTARNFVAGAVTYGVGKALGSSEHWNTVDMLTDAFGNALGSEIAGPYDRARMVQEQGKDISLRMQGTNGKLSARNDQNLQSLFGSVRAGTSVIEEPFLVAREHRRGSTYRTEAGANIAAVDMYGSQDGAVAFRVPGTSRSFESPKVNYDTVLQNIRTGVEAPTTPTLYVVPDWQRSADSMNLWGHAHNYHLSAPTGADANSLSAYRYATDQLRTL